MDKEYDLTEILVNLENSDSDALQTSDNNDVITNNINTTTTHELEPAIAQQATNINILDKLYMPCVGSKLTQTVRRNKSMTTTISKLKEVHWDHTNLHLS